MPRIFVCYSRKDSRWVRTPEGGRDLALMQWIRLKLKPRGIEVWSDEALENLTGAAYDQVIEDTIDTSETAVLILSDDFFLSDYIAGKELPRIRARVERGEMQIFPIVVGAHVDWGQNDDSVWLNSRQIHPSAITPLITVVGSPAEWDAVRSKLAVALREQVLGFKPVSVSEEEARRQEAEKQRREEESRKQAEYEEQRRKAEELALAVEEERRKAAEAERIRLQMEAERRAEVEAERQRAEKLAREIEAERQRASEAEERRKVLEDLAKRNAAELEEERRKAARLEGEPKRPALPAPPAIGPHQPLTESSSEDSVDASAGPLSTPQPKARLESLPRPLRFLLGYIFFPAFALLSLLFTILMASLIFSEASRDLWAGFLFCSLLFLGFTVVLSRAARALIHSLKK